MARGILRNNENMRSVRISQRQNALLKKTYYGGTGAPKDMPTYRKYSQALFAHEDKYGFRQNKFMSGQLD